MGAGGVDTVTNYAGQNIICCHDYPKYIDADGYVRCDECDRVVGINH
jgi:hypothetical protein